MVAAAGLDRSLTPKWAAEVERRAKVRRRMRQRCAPDETGNVYTLTHSLAVGRKSDIPVPEFSGSSYNRKRYDNKTDEKRAAPRRTQAMRRMEFFKLLDSETDLSADDLRGKLVSDSKSKRVPVHVVAARSRSKIRDKFNSLFTATNCKATFATFSFIQRVDDITAVQILNKFLTSLRKKKAQTQYIWVAERQKENKAFPDNIHFHMLVNHYMPIAQFNALWVLQQYNAGLKGYSHKKKRTLELSDIMDLIKDPKDLQQFLNPLDVRKVHSVDALAGYLTMYVTKNRDSFACAAWHCSRGVSRTFTRRAISRELFLSTEGGNNFSVDKKTGEYFRGKIIMYPAKPFFCLSYILNKKHYRNHLKILECINRWILYDNFIPDVPMMEMHEYYSRVHNEQLN
jgi:hypothetical protein